MTFRASDRRQPECPPLLIINGVAGSGKSTLAELLSPRLHLPVIGKDTIKEALGDSLGAETPQDSNRLGLASFAVMISLTKAMVHVGVGAVIEAPFYGEFGRALGPLASQCHAALIQCDADVERISERLKRREAARHPVHFDDCHRQLKASTPMTWKLRDLEAAIPPKLDIPILSVNTTDGYQPELDSLMAWVRKHLQI